MKKDTVGMEMQAAHAQIGGFIVRCSLVDYRISQFIARWFCAHEKQKFLSYTLRAMPFASKRAVVEERLANWHGDPAALGSTFAEIAELFEYRELVATGILSRRSTGELCIKSFSAERHLSDPNAIDIIRVDELEILSEKASELSERLIALGNGLSDAEG